MKKPYIVKEFVGKLNEIKNYKMFKEKINFHDIMMSPPPSQPHGEGTK